MPTIYARKQQSSSHKRAGSILSDAVTEIERHQPASQKEAALLKKSRHMIFEVIGILGYEIPNLYKKQP